MMWERSGESHRWPYLQMRIQGLGKGSGPGPEQGLGQEPEQDHRRQGQGHPPHCRHHEHGEPCPGDQGAEQGRSQWRRPRQLACQGCQK